MRTKDKIMGAVVLLLVITFLPMQTACAGTITDAYKSLSNYVKTSRPYNYIVTSRPYNYVATSRPYNYAVSSIGSIVESVSNLVGKSGSPGMGGFTILATKTVTKVPATAELSVLRSSTNITKTPIHDEKSANKSAGDKLADGLMEELIGNKLFPNENTIPYRKNSFGAGVYRKIEEKTYITHVPTNDNSSKNGTKNVNPYEKNGYTNPRSWGTPWYRN